MVKVAVAGGNSSIGRHIVEEILATKKHTVIVLSRSSSSPTLEALGAQIVAVDYTDHKSLVSALQGVHTVISTIFSKEQIDTLVTSQLALLNAAVETGVKRFAPSEWAVHGRSDDPIAFYRFKTVVTDAIAKSGIESTVFENGLFMNYFAAGTKGLGHLPPNKYMLDMQAGTATLPGDGNRKVTFTRGEDVGRFVAASLDLEKWPARSGMASDVISFNEVVTVAEKVTGRKFEVKYLLEDTLRSFVNPNPENAFTNFSSEFMIEIAYTSRFVYEANLNALCPQVKPVGVEEFLRKWF